MFNKLRKLLVLLLIILNETGSTSAGCTFFSSKCDFKNRGLTTVPTKLRGSIVSLDLTKNAITVIPPSAFAGNWRLAKLYLDSNQLTSIHLDAFQYLRLLQELTLSSNKITHIQPGLPNLQMLLLSSNNIKNIQSGIFSGLPKLRILSLDSNHITTIQPGTFSDQVFSVTIHNNPWQCDSFYF
ncbi:slit homolog 2 protein-like [Branchiostoma floridae]|uniref:Slit homolog 2 protein-like n=1 Tax=Branchiostoma floridae TaxID=7739 RepID=A0A9J7N0S5_BRAFL|nr:slit homolog 2 protein-like [Branchiostoma floridae]